jgi:hypothetical protein
MTRRAFVKALALGGLSGLAGIRSARADGEPRGATVDWARLKFTCWKGNTDNWNVHPQGDLNLIEHLNARTTVRIRNKWNVADGTRLHEMTQYPFLFMTAELPPELGSAERANLREYLLRGGVIFAEDCVIGKTHKNGTGLPVDAFFLGMSQEFRRILPEARLERVPLSHPVFHCFYDLPDGLPVMQGVAHGLHGLFLEGRVVAFLSASDNHCGWAGSFFKKEMNTAALQMGTNIYIYAMTQGG